MMDESSDEGEKSLELAEKPPPWFLAFAKGQNKKLNIIISEMSDMNSKIEEIKEKTADMDERLKEVEVEVGNIKFDLEDM
eukprot:258833-Pyramimonas_sp.AAC.1